MVSKFAIFGSCTCRDIFNSEINNNYKDYFQIQDSGIRLSFISIMQNPIEYPKDSLKIYPETDENINFSNWIKQDLEKSFLEELKKNQSEYMILDTYYDTNFGIINLGNGRYITNNLHIDETEFYKNLEYKRTMSIHTDTKEYLDLWMKNCDLFFDFLKNNCKDLKIILNPARHVNRLLKKDKSVIEVEAYKKVCAKYNPYRNILDKYIIENFDVDVLYFDENTLASEEHYWGLSSLHYDTSYYADSTKQMNDIIKRNSILENLSEELIQKFKKQNRYLLLFKIESQENNKLTLKFIQRNSNLTSIYNDILDLNKDINDELVKLNNINEITNGDYEFLINLNIQSLDRLNELNEKNRIRHIPKITPFLKRR